MDGNQPLFDLPYEVQIDAGDLFHAEDNFTVPSSRQSPSPSASPNLYPVNYFPTPKTSLTGAKNCFLSTTRLNSPLPSSIYWPHVDNFWTKQGSTRWLKNGSYYQQYACLLHRTRVTAPENMGMRARHRTMRTAIGCKRRIKVTHHLSRQRPGGDCGYKQLPS
ncbi:hypothetical protein QBC33DRAFT_296534 [Phialemonium atrogriseum]|uniref:Uncharacterized protein n=1 Tax=Phialemonium atrogriseum TaxID=1093897 RepID=A0AAJ0FHB2_9PEZI|nr:uncharacterized protein QBC33DRAFT_296534 [Phialemonium atrogriseum]KAK1761984.1 hypothetical protein QBC33DRAFT_296534 [Phialemonium atrogriseum]